MSGRARGTEGPGQLPASRAQGGYYRVDGSENMQRNWDNLGCFLIPNHPSSIQVTF